MNQYLGKFDFYATRNDRISLTLGYNKEPLNPFFGANVPGFSAATTTWDYFANIGYTKTITATTLNELRLAVRTSRQRSKNNAIATDWHTSPSNSFGTA